MKRESITIQKNHKGIWFKRFDDYETKFTRCGKKQASETIRNARARGDVYSEGNENSKDWEVWGIWN